MPAGMWWPEVSCNFLRQRPVDGGPRVFGGTSLWHQVCEAWLSRLHTGAKVLYLAQHGPTDCNSMGLVSCPSVRVLLLQESPVEALLSAIHLSWRCW